MNKTFKDRKHIKYNDKYYNISSIDGYYNFMNNSNDWVTEIVELLVSVKDLKGFEPEEDMPNLLENIENVNLDFTMTNTSRLVFIDAINKVKMVVGEIYFKNGSFDSYNDLLVFERDFKTIKDFYSNKDLPNFTITQEKDSKRLSNDFNEDLLRTVLKTYSESIKWDLWL